MAKNSNVAGKKEIAKVRSWNNERRFGFAIANNDREIVHLYGVDRFGDERAIEIGDEIGLVRKAIKGSGKVTAAEWSLEPEKDGIWRVKLLDVVIWKGPIDLLLKEYPYKRPNEYGFGEESDPLRKKGEITFEKKTVIGWIVYSDPRVYT